MMDLLTDFVRALATFRRWQGLCRRATRLSIIFMVDNDIHMGERGGCQGGQLWHKVFKGPELCVHHVELCSVYEVDGGTRIYPEGGEHGIASGAVGGATIGQSGLRINSSCT